MTTLTILRGVSGSGKSTWARQQSAVVVSRDAIRLAFFGSDDQDYYQVSKEELSEKEQTVTVLQDAAVAGALKAGKNVIVDNTNVEWKFVKALAKIGYRYGADVSVKLFDVSVTEAMNRNGRRAKSGGRDVPLEVIQRQHERLKHTRNKQLDPVFYPKPYHGAPGKPKAFLCDLDGTLAEFENVRGPYDTNVENDEPIETIIDIVDALWASGLKVVFMSGRKEAARQGTENWLHKYVMFRGWELFMRPDDDNRSDNLVKAALFDEHVRNNYDVQFVLDDRDQVVETWRRMGLTCLQVAEGDF